MFGWRGEEDSGGEEEEELSLARRWHRCDNVSQDTDLICSHERRRLLAGSLTPSERGEGGGGGPIFRRVRASPCCETDDEFDSQSLLSCARARALPQPSPSRTHIKIVSKSVTATALPILASCNNEPTAIMLGRALLTIDSLGLLLGAWFADYNSDSHIFNPRWPPHAK